MGQEGPGRPQGPPSAPPDRYAAAWDVDADLLDIVLVLQESQRAKQVSELAVQMLEPTLFADAMYQDDADLLD